MNLHRNRNMLCAVAMVALTACGPQHPNVTPQASIAHYGNDTVLAINAFQAFIVKGSEGPTPLISIDIAEPIMGSIRAALISAQQLSVALKEYDALTVGVQRQAKAQQIVTIVNGITRAGLLAWSTALPPALQTEGLRLAGNAEALIASIRAALAAGSLS